MRKMCVIFSMSYKCFIFKVSDHSLRIARANPASRERFIACTNYDNRSHRQTTWNVAPTSLVYKMPGGGLMKQLRMFLTLIP